MIVMTNHISYGLNLTNRVSITSCMSLPGLEERRKMSFSVEIGLFLILYSDLQSSISVRKQAKWLKHLNIFQSK